MGQFGKYRKQLDPKREQLLCNYVSDRRYRFMMTLYLSGAAAVLGAPLAIHDLSTVSMDAAFPLLPDMETLMLARRYSRYRYIPGSLFFWWVIDLLLFLILFMKGVGRQFGSGSDYHCITRHKYVCHTMIVGGIDAGCSKHPYRIFDETGKACICPVFLDYKHSVIGEEMLCITLDNGNCYAMAIEKSD